MSPVTKMSEPSQQTGSEQTEFPWMSSAEDSRARTLAFQGSEQGWMGPALAYGTSTPDWLANYDHVTLSWRTRQACLVSGWTEFSETWPRSGLTQSGTAYQLAPLVPITSEIVSGLLPTPTKTDHKSESMSLALVQRRQNESGRGVRLSEFLHRKTLPTPNAGNDHWGGRLDEWGGSTNPFRGTEIGRLPLNPCWVEELMGFPIEWTALEP
jgi:hypothetical protein